MSSTLFLILFFGFIAYRIISSVMGPGFDVSEEARKRLEARQRQTGQPQPRQPQVQPQSRGTPVRSNAPRQGTAGRSSANLPRPSSPRRAAAAQEEDEFDWYIVLDVPPDAPRREILEAVKRRLQVAHSVGDSLAPARIARAAATGMKRFGTTGTRGPRP